jgi:hypothetical protein
LKREEEGNIHRLFNHQEDVTKGLSANDLHTAMDVCRGVLAGPARTESGNQKSEIRNQNLPNAITHFLPLGQSKRKAEIRNQKAFIHPLPPSGYSPLSQGEKVGDGVRQFLISDF